MNIHFNNKTKEYELWSGEYISTKGYTRERGVSPSRILRVLKDQEVFDYWEKEIETAAYKAERAARKKEKDKLMDEFVNNLPVSWDEGFIRRYREIIDCHGNYVMTINKFESVENIQARIDKIMIEGGE